MNIKKIGIEDYGSLLQESTTKEQQNAPFSIIRLIKTWQSRAHQRHELSKRTPAQLRDMGISEQELAEELNKPFWKA